jgi:hypothetical protein
MKCAAGEARMEAASSATRPGPRAASSQGDRISGSPYQMRSCRYTGLSIGFTSSPRGARGFAYGQALVPMGCQIRLEDFARIFAQHPSLFVMAAKAAIHDSDPRDSYICTI